MNIIPTPLDQGFQTPTLVRRMACWVYEGVLLFGVVFLSGYLFATLTQSRHGLANQGWFKVYLFTVLGIYFVWFWHKGQTLAMKTWHLRLVRHDLTSVTQKQALMRYVLSWIWFLPPLMLSGSLPIHRMWGGVLVLVWVVLWAWSARYAPHRQFWHDVWAKTRLIYVPPNKT